MRLFPIVFLLVACDTSVDQSQACAEWVSCIDARDAQLGITTDNDRFQLGGDCWGNPEIGELCDKACIAGLDQMRTAYDDLPEACL
ncbi:MAG: hypothetical protein KTR31_33355 [Myxococcales bacterium]|nr:hypothetical protein [Myxococcales bacterium]